MSRHQSATDASAWAEQDSHRVVVEDLTEVICRLLPDGTFLYVNDAYCRFFGKRREELLGNSWRPIAVHEDLPLIESRLAMLSPETPVVTIENRVYDHAGNVRWMQFLNRAFFDKEGRLVETQAVGRDITERVEAEIKLTESQQRWQFALESSGFGVWDWDIKNDRIFYSVQWKVMLGYAPNEVLPEKREDFLEMLHPEDQKSVLTQTKEHFSGATPDFIHEFRLRCKDGSWKWMIGRGRVIEYEENHAPQRMIGTIVDVSARKAAEEREIQSLNLVAEGAAAAEVWEAIVYNLEAAFPGMRCSIMLVDEHRKGLRLKAAPSLPASAREGINSLEIDPNGCCCAAAVALGKRVISKDLLSDKRMASELSWVKDAGLRACWSEPIIGSTGIVLGVLACYRDMPHDPPQAEITRVAKATRLVALAMEREEQAQALHANEERYAKAISGTRDGLWDWDLKTGDVYISPRWKQMLGISQRESSIRDEEWFRSKLHQEDAPKLRAAINEHLEKKAPYVVELRLLTKQGKYRWFASRGQAEWDEAGKAIRMTGILSDIHEQKTAEQNYLRELAYNRALLNHISALIVVMDTAGRIIHANAAFFNTMGYSEREILGRTPWEIGLMETQERPRSQLRFARLLRGEDNPPIDVRLRTREGIWRTVELRSTSTRKSDGSTDRIIITANDITERERLQRELLRVVEEEQARIGHDLHDGVGQTMTGILVLMETLESQLKGRNHEDAARIYELMKESVAEVRRMSHGLSPAHVKYRGLAGALRLLAETVRTNFRTPCECTVDAAACVESEDKQTHLFRIAQEAVNNALRHGKPSKVSISLRHLENEKYELVIEDDGSGLKKKAKTAPSAGIGMQVMQHRAQLIGARLQIAAKPKPQRGVIVICRFEGTFSPEIKSKPQRKRRKKREV